jgi:hypothetical protein
MASQRCDGEGEGVGVSCGDRRPQLGSSLSLYGSRLIEASVLPATFRWSCTTSVVSLGYDKSNGKPVAVKMVKCTRSQFSNLRNEIDILRRLNHVSRDPKPYKRN